MDAKKVNILLPYKLWIFILIYFILGYNVGFIMDGYARFLHFDKFVHFISGFLNFIIGLIFYLYFNKKYKVRWLLAVLFSLFFSIFIAVGGEFIECAVFVSTGYDAQRTLSTGVMDTMGDLTACFIGSIIMTIIYIRIGGTLQLADNTIVSAFCQLNNCTTILK